MQYSLSWIFECIPINIKLRQHTCCVLGLLSRTAWAASLSIALSSVLLTPTSCPTGIVVQSALVPGARSLLLRRNDLSLRGACGT